MDLSLTAEILVTLIIASLRNHSSVIVSRSPTHNVKECRAPLGNEGGRYCTQERQHGKAAATADAASNSTAEHVSKHRSKKHFKLMSQKI